MDFLHGRESGLIVDCIFVLLFFVAHTKLKNSASKSVLFFCVFIPVFAYCYLFAVEYMYKFNVDYNLIMAGLVSAFFIHVLIVSRGHGLLLCAIGLNVLLHAVMIIKEPAQQMHLISPKGYTVIYDSYENARILIVSLQLLGLTLGGKYGRYSDINNRFRSDISRAFDDFRVHSIRLLRAKRS